VAKKAITINHNNARIGATENAGVENAARAKMRGWKMQE